MYIVLWGLQIILGIKLLTVTVTHGFGQSKPTLQEAIQKMGLLARPMLALAAGGALLAAAGLILPGLLHLSNLLTLLAAGLTAALLTGSLFFHLRARMGTDAIRVIVLCPAACIIK
jgi:hypothetical protein